MDAFNSTGLSWADQWDPEPLPPPSAKDDKKGKSGSQKIKSMKKKILSLLWVKNPNEKSPK
ncbi:hypothetical protein NMG60_11030877 [Bertholletia excelsa]